MEFLKLTVKNNPQMFQFKQFSINDSNCGMKVGVDGVLLGAWISQSSASEILDVGTGSGLIALMMAQKFPKANIHGIEMEKEAVNQAQENFKASNFKNKFRLHHADFLNFDEQKKNKKTAAQYDLIISNLPYFSGDEQHFSNHKRFLARSSANLPLKSFLAKSSELLSEKGSIYFVYPKSELSNVYIAVRASHLHIQGVLYIKGTEKSTVKRCLFKLKKEPPTTNCTFKELTIEKARGHFTKQYKEFCKDFYLKF